VYDGGSTGANYNLALHHAKVNNKRYFAVSRAVADGHAFAFGKLQLTGRNDQTQGGGCERPCMDLGDKPCGCMDSECTGPVMPGEEHNRRWAVYEVL
jgi:dolichyl-diphosphooligosaccharide---protein glycosyltransferase